MPNQGKEGNIRNNNWGCGIQNDYIHNQYPIYKPQFLYEIYSDNRESN